MGRQRGCGMPPAAEPAFGAQHHVRPLQCRVQPLPSSRRHQGITRDAGEFRDRAPRSHVEWCRGIVRVRQAVYGVSTVARRSQAQHERRLREIPEATPRNVRLSVVNGDVPRRPGNGWRPDCTSAELYPPPSLERRRPEPVRRDAMASPKQEAPPESVRVSMPAHPSGHAARHGLRSSSQRRQHTKAAREGPRLHQEVHVGPASPGAFAHHPVAARDSWPRLNQRCGEYATTSTGGRSSRRRYHVVSS